jgi:hypothetical protein
MLICDYIFECLLKILIFLQMPHLLHTMYTWRKRCWNKRSSIELVLMGHITLNASQAHNHIYIYTSIYKRLEASDNHTIYLSHWISKLLRILNIIYVWRLNHTVLELDFRAVKFLLFPRRDLNPHHWYTAAPFAKRMVPWEWMWSSGLGRWT